MVQKWVRPIKNGVIDLFSDLATAISTLGSLVNSMPAEVCFLDGHEGNRIPCEMAFVPKNEEACQLAIRVETVINYLSERCAVLIDANISVRIAQLHQAAKTPFFLDWLFW